MMDELHLLASLAAPAVGKTCTPGNEDRTSELCAQWMSVDASRLQAHAADRMVDLGISSLVLSIATLGAAIYAALQAKRGATAAISQANHSANLAFEQIKNNSVQHAIQANQNRGRLIITDSPPLILTAQGVTQFSFQVENSGSSLANAINFEVHLICKNPNGRNFVTSAAASATLPSLIPGVRRSVSVQLDFDKEAVAQFGNTWFAVELMINIQWLDAFGFGIIDQWRCDGSACIDAMPAPLTPHLVEHAALLVG